MGIERAVIEALLEAAKGRLLKATIAIRKDVSWNDANQGFKDAKRRLDLKIKPFGYVLQSDRAYAVLRMISAKTSTN